MTKLIMKHRCWCGSTEFEMPEPGEVTCKQCSRQHDSEVFFADEEDLVCEYCEGPANYVVLIPSVSLYVCEEHKSRTGTAYLVPIDGTTAPDGTGGSPTDEASQPNTAKSATGADEKGLKLSHRFILRFIMEYARSLKAITRIDGSTELNAVVNEANVMASIRDLLVLGTAIAERIGSPKEVTAYLNRHEDEDEAELAKTESNHKHSVQERMHEHIKEKVEEMLLRGDPCPTCRTPMCIKCETCHKCEEAKIEAEKKEQLN